MSFSAVIPKVELGRDAAVSRLNTELARLNPTKAYVVEVKEKKPKRSENQNSLLWALYADILRIGGEAMGGWTKEELHEFFLGEHTGWKVKTMFGKKKQTPRRRSSDMNKQEFSDFVDSIVRRMAEEGVVLSLPGDL